MEKPTTPPSCRGYLPLHQLKRPPCLHRPGVGVREIEKLDHLRGAEVFRACELFVEDFDSALHALFWSPLYPRPCQVLQAAWIMIEGNSG